jgi:2-polyprenyl-3-methyl-5-hydroxy-6-metoxy-1,4-benzoquinol methylase
MVATEPCPVCGSVDAHPVVSRRGFSYVRCSHCRAVYVSPMPLAEEVARIYQDLPILQATQNSVTGITLAMHKVLAPHFRRRLWILGRWLPERGRLLDVGCADGFFLELARADGWEVAGVEISEPMAEETARQLGVPVVTSIEKLPEGAVYDAVTLWEVVEHFREPVAELRRLAQRLRPGGALMLSTPNVGHWQAMNAPDAWNLFCPPAHLVLFTDVSLKVALEKAGYSGIRIWKVSPLPPLPKWLEKSTAPLARRLADGSARPWMLARALWLAVRLLGWAWQRLTRPQEDIFATLEAMAWRPG